MSIERSFHCDAPDCFAYIGECSTPEPPAPGWIVAHVTGGDAEPLHFCTWDCAMKYAATIPAPEIIPLHGDES